jgi:hypothetical protein
MHEHDIGLCNDPYPPELFDPCPNRTTFPYVDSSCRALLDQAVLSLITLRGGATLDPGARLSVLASLAHDADGRIPDTVWIARVHHGYTWNDIAERLGITAKTARYRYRPS